MSLSERLAAFHLLAEKATQGPWHIFNDRRGSSLQIGGKGQEVGRNPCIIHWMGFDGCDLPKTKRVANANFIAALPDVMQLARDAVQRCKELERDAARYRWLRDTPDISAVFKDGEVMQTAPLDAAIDAITKEASNGNQT